jgi:hypothetical protein
VCPFGDDWIREASDLLRIGTDRLRQIIDGLAVANAILNFAWTRHLADHCGLFGGCVAMFPGNDGDEATVDR